MKEISKKLAISLLVVIILTTLITTFAFFQIQQNMMKGNYYFPAKTTMTGKVGVNIPQNTVPATVDEGGKVSIKIQNSEGK